MTSKMVNDEFARIRRVLIYRLASLGDTVVSLPCLHLVARAFPNAERRVLTNVNSGAQTTALQSVIENTGLVHSYFTYDTGTRNVRKLVSLWRRIYSWNPEIVIYLMPSRGRFALLRDVAFLSSAARPKHFFGVPWDRDLASHRRNTRGVLEKESERLARCLLRLGDAKLEDQGSWDLRINQQEFDAAFEHLQEWPSSARYFACAVGAKIQSKDWGEQNWATLMGLLSRRFPQARLVLVGAANEHARSENVRKSWKGPSINLCGKIGVRETAALFSRAELFISHDSGPMHLAAAQQVPCVAIFSAKNIPEVWYPYGTQHAVLYHKTSCSGCNLDVCIEEGKRCILSITPSEVLSAVEHLASARGYSGQ